MQQHHNLLCPSISRAPALEVSDGNSARTLTATLNRQIPETRINNVPKTRAQSRQLTPFPAARHHRPERELDHTPRPRVVQFDRGRAVQECFAYSGKSAEARAHWDLDWARHMVQSCNLSRPTESYMPRMISQDSSLNSGPPIMQVQASWRLRCLGPFWGHAGCR
jgi:hypothetical protein